MPRLGDRVKIQGLQLLLTQSSGPLSKHLLEPIMVDALISQLAPHRAQAREQGAAARALTKSACEGVQHTRLTKIAVSDFRCGCNELVCVCINLQMFGTWVRSGLERKSSEAIRVL